MMTSSRCRALSTGRLRDTPKNKAARRFVYFDYMSTAVLSVTNIRILVPRREVAFENRWQIIGCGPAKIRTFITNFQKGLAGDFPGAVQSWRVAHIGNQIIKVLNDIFMKPDRQTRCEGE